MGTRHIKLPIGIVQQLKKIKNKRYRNAWRKQFKNDYAAKEMYAAYIVFARKPIPENPSEFDRKFYANQRELLPKWEGELKDIKERISTYQVQLQDFLNGEQTDIEKYQLMFLR